MHFSATLFNLIFIKFKIKQLKYKLDFNSQKLKFQIYCQDFFEKGKLFETLFKNLFENLFGNLFNIFEQSQALRHCFE